MVKKTINKLSHAINAFVYIQSKIIIQKLHTIIF